MTAILFEAILPFLILAVFAGALGWLGWRVLLPWPASVGEDHDSPSASSAED